MNSKLPWYRHGWVWALIAIPATAVVAGFTTLWLAISSDDGLVVDDYYVRGKEVNRVLERDHAATQLGLESTVELDPSAQTLDLRLTAAAADYRLPEHVTLRLLHATRDGLDRTLQLAGDGSGRYHSALAQLAPGHWYLQLEADDWRLNGSLMVPGATLVQIDAAPLK